VEGTFEQQLSFWCFLLLYRRVEPTLAGRTVGAKDPFSGVPWYHCYYWASEWLFICFCFWFTGCFREMGLLPRVRPETRSHQCNCYNTMKDRSQRKRSWSTF